MGDKYKKSQWEDSVTKKIDIFFKGIKKYGDENVKLSEIDNIVITKEECCRIKEIENKNFNEFTYIM